MHSPPPRRSNPLSFLTTAVFVWVLSCIWAATETAAATNNCVCNYDPNVDYFPNKIAPNFSKNFQLEYFKSYKKLTTIDSTGAAFVTYAYLCGTPVPNEGSVNNSIEIPIKTTAVTSTTFLPFISYLGEEANSLTFVSALHENFKPCLRKMYDAGQVADGFTFTPAAMRLANASAYARTGEALDVVFMDDYSFTNGGLPDEVLSVLGPRTKSIYLGSTVEKTPLGILEWVEVVAALFNREYDVLDLVTRLNARYVCVKDVVAAKPPQPARKKVLWGNCFFNSFTNEEECWVAAECPNYYCDLVADAGGDLIISSKSPPLTTDEMYDLAAQADVWIYVDANWNQSSQYSPAFFNATVAEKYANLSVIQSQQVYDILRRNFNDWFDDAQAEPGVLLMDLTQAFYGEEYIANTERQRVFLRNVFTEPMAFQGPRLASECVNASAPLYTDWANGSFCTLPDTQTVVPNPDKQLCTTSVGSGGGILNAATGLMVTVLALAMQLLVAI